MLSGKLLHLSRLVYSKADALQVRIRFLIKEHKRRYRIKESKRFLLAWKIMDNAGTDTATVHPTYSIRYFNKMYKKLGKSSR